MRRKYLTAAKLSYIIVLYHTPWKRGKIMLITIRKAEKGEYEKVRDFYYKLIDDMRFSEYHPKWQKGIYPEDSYLENAVTGKEMYIALSGGEIVGAMILNSHTTDGYEKVSWGIEAYDNEITVIHALGVTPLLSRKGIAKALVREVVRISREEDKKAIRLDVLVGNIPAQKLYENLGFVFRQGIKLFYEDTGECDFDIYEFVL